MRTLIVRSGILAWCVVLILTGCGERVTPVEIANEEQILLKGNGAEVATLDMHLATGVTEYKVLTALFEGLMRPNPKTVAPVEPAVAERYEMSEGGTRYTFYLRENARWSNGDPVTAHDFVFAYQRILSPKLAGEYAYMLYPMVNAEAYNKGEITDFSKVGVKALDDRTLQIDLQSPTPYFLSLLIHYTWWPVHPPTILAHGDIDTRDSKWTRPGNMVSNGPFTLERWSMNDVLVTRKNPLYWDADNVKLNGVNFLPIDNLNTEERAFRAGQIHITESIPLSKIDSYKARNDPALKINPYLGIYYYLLNTSHAPLDKPKVRKALSLALDRQMICDQILRGGQSPAFHFTPPDTAGYTTEFKLTENVAEARKLLAEAGYPNGKGFPTLEILYNTSESHKLIAEAIQQMWRKNLGIDVALINQDWKVYLQSRREGTFDIARAAWIGDFNDPVTFLELMQTDSGNNHSRWGSEKFDALLAKASKTQDQKERYAILQQAEALMLEEQPVIPIYFYMSAYLVNPAVKGWYPNIMDEHPYWAVWLEED